MYSYPMFHQQRKLSGGSEGTSEEPVAAAAAAAPLDTSLTKKKKKKKKREEEGAAAADGVAVAEVKCFASTQCTVEQNDAPEPKFRPWRGSGNIRSIHCPPPLPYLCVCVYLVLTQERS